VEAEQGAKGSGGWRGLGARGDVSLTGGDRGDAWAWAWIWGLGPRGVASV
jgi:hypothetical protein